MKKKKDDFEQVQRACQKQESLEAWIEFLSVLVVLVIGGAGFLLIRFFGWCACACAKEATNGIKKGVQKLKSLDEDLIYGKNMISCERRDE